MDNVKKTRGGQREDAIDILKFLAALLITNSHMNNLYPDKYGALATGGALGDSIFFFCSGFLLLRGCCGNFFNWYKKRINRIYPTLFAVAIVSIVFFGYDPSFKSVIISEHAWFVQCIIVFYAVFWFVIFFLKDRLRFVISIVGIVSIAWYIFLWDKNNSIFLLGTYLRWPIFFCAMLLGSFTAQKKTTKQISKNKPLFSLLLFLAMMGLFYGYQIIKTKYSILKECEIIIAPILLVAVYELYNICSSEAVINIYKKRGVYGLVFFVSSLCLEIYLSQWWIFPYGESLINLFPMNIIICFLLVVIAAFVVKVLGNFIGQTFKSEDYDWKRMVSLK